MNPPHQRGSPQPLRTYRCFCFTPPCTRSTFCQSTDGSEFVTAEVNIVEEEQHMLRKHKRGSQIQLDAGRRNSIMQQQVNTPCCCREFDDDDHQRCSLSLFHKSPRPALPAARVRARARDQPESELTCCGGASNFPRVFVSARK